MRGVHCHLDHDDFVVIATGEFAFGLVDARPNSPTSGRSMMFDLDTTRAIVIPAGVAHGFYARDEGVMLVGVTEEFDPAATLRCRFDDPELGLEWPSASRLVSELDRDAPPFNVMRDAVRAAFAPDQSVGIGRAS
jgi:dTDP-4-dehydrorhamnose 3,5-epimerase